MDNDLFADNTPKTAQELADFLRIMADKIESGGMTITRGSDLLELEFPQRFGFRFKVKDDVGRSTTKRKVQVGFRWRVGEEESTKPDNSMVIT